MFDVNKMGDRIKELRGNIPQDICANDLGISRGALSFYEHGKRKPDADVLYEMCKYFGVSADYILGLSDVKTPDINFKSICDYTGLNEEAIENIINRTNMPKPIIYDGVTKTTYSATVWTPRYYKKYKKVLNTLFSCSYFWEIVFQYVVMESLQHKTYNLQDKYNEVREKMLNGASAEDIHSSAEIIMQNSSDIDVARYTITKFIEKVSDIFDYRVNTPEREQFIKEINKEVPDNGNDNPQKE